MKQVIYRKKGSPEVLEIVDMSIPKFKKGEVLVKMLATSVNGGDLGLRRGNPNKVQKEMKHPKVIGIDVVGIVDKLGEGVTDLKIGDMVWGNSGPSNGTTAEYFAIPAKKVSLMPKGMKPTTAAAFPTVGITAITALLDVGKLKSGEKILIRGTGGVGLTAIQIAKAHGAYVCALCSGKMIDDVKKYGANEAYDYRKTSINELEQFDLIFDTAGGSLNELRKHLTSSGRLVTVVVSDALNVLTSLVHGKHRTHLALGFSTKKRLDYLKDMVIKGQIVPVIDSVYSIDQIVEAHKRAEERGVLGKIVINIASE